MSEPGEGKEKTRLRERITVTLPAGLHERLSAFCREMKIPPDLVVERALAEYFREGDVSH